MDGIHAWKQQKRLNWQTLIMEVTVIASLNMWKCISLNSAIEVTVVSND